MNEIGEFEYLIFIRSLGEYTYRLTAPGGYLIFKI